MIDSYAWPGGREAVLRFGPDDAPRIVFAPALFEEANRTRAFVVAVMRTLAADGLASALPDLPATNESLAASEDATLGDWRSALASIAGERPGFVATVRGGALIDADADAIGRYRIAPVDGATVVRDLIRIRRAADAAFDPHGIDVPGPPIAFGGRFLARSLLVDLRGAHPGPSARIVRLTTDPAPADHRIDGRPLWRGAEPDVDDTLVVALAADIAGWMRSCAG